MACEHGSPPLLTFVNRGDGLYTLSSKQVFRLLPLVAVKSFQPAISLLKQRSSTTVSSSSSSSPHPTMAPAVRLLLIFLLLLPLLSRGSAAAALRFGNNGAFKILQVADMHYAEGARTACLDVLPGQKPTCSDLNTTAFLRRVIRAESPDLIVFTGDNIFGYDTSDAGKSLDMAFQVAVESGIPWAAVLGNHDQESTLTREGLMNHIVGMPYALSRVNPDGLRYEIDGFGNYNLEVGGVAGSPMARQSVLNLYFVDSGDYSTVPSIPGYGWIKPSQQLWFQQTSRKLKKRYLRQKVQKGPAPSLVYFHIPLPEFGAFDSLHMTGVRQEGISSASINSGFFTTLAEAGDVKAVFTGHDHLNDFCGKLKGVHLCYAGGFGYHAYGKAGWPRRARVVNVLLEKTLQGSWGDVKSISTWKRLDDKNLSTIDTQILWNRGSGES